MFIRVSDVAAIGSTQEPFFDRLVPTGDLSVEVRLAFHPGDLLALEDASEATANGFLDEDDETLGEEVHTEA